jgi:hypothetical protein
MRTTKIPHFNLQRVVLDRFLKVGEARLYKVFDFVHFGASAADHLGILSHQPLHKACFDELKVIVFSTMKES